LSGEECAVVGEDGTRNALPADRWLEAADESDRRLFVGPCSGPTLDVGCGPGRLVLALQRHGVPAHGIDVSAEAVDRARECGASVSQADVFAPVSEWLPDGQPAGLPEGLSEGLPGEGRWAHALLADGNVGIGGRPDRLLGRIRELLAPGGRVHVELHAGADIGVTTTNVRLHVGGRHSTPFRWATVGMDAIADVAAEAGLQLLHIDSAADRHVAVLARKK
jgi:SAM-dependent methyltransferase